MCIIPFKLRHYQRNTALPPETSQQLIPSLCTALSRRSEQGAVVGKDGAGGIVAGGAGDAAAGVGAGAAVIEALQRPAVVGMAEHRPRGEQLVQRQRAVEDVAAEQA